MPHAFQPFFEIYSGREFPYAFFDPAKRAFSTRIHAKLVCVLDDEVRIYEKENNRVNEIFIQVEDVNYIESGTSLLYSWITINLAAGSRISNYTLAFSTAAQSFYKPVIDCFRSVPYAKRVDLAERAEEEKGKFDFLIEQNHKLMNFGRRSIEPGEEVRQILFQPEIKLPYLKLFGKKSYKLFLKTSLMVLTDTELILIRESDNISIDCAAVEWYFSLGRIKHLNVEYSDDFKKCILDIVFYDENHLCLEVEKSKYKEAKRMQAF
jgi:hypothetical protein